MKNRFLLMGALFLSLLVACDNDDDVKSNTGGNDDDQSEMPVETPPTEPTPIDTSALEFSKIGGFANGSGEGFSEISAFDPTTDKLFIVNAEDKVVSVWDLSDATAPVEGTPISLSGTPNSVAVNNGLLAVAVEGASKQDTGKIQTFNTATQASAADYTAGALPDMVTFSPDGVYIIAANEGEPNDEYTDDPEGTVTIVEVATGTTTQLGFTAFNGQDIGNGFRVFGNNGTATLAQDIEPEYVAVSDDSSTAYVALQENNGLAIIDLGSKTITELVGLGNKDHNLAGNTLDASNKDDVVGNFKNWNVLGMYQPDAITYANIGGTGYIISANEGDARDYDGYSEEVRVKDLVLDPTAYPDAATLQEDANLGRLKTTTAAGDTDDDGDIDQIYSYGARSFSIWNTDGTLFYDSGDEIGTRTFGLMPEIFNQDEGDVDDRSDDKGAEPEAVTTLQVEGATLLFVGLERTGGVLAYDITNPASPVFLDWMFDASDVGPEGLITVAAADSPTGNALVIVTSEVSSTIAIYEVK